MKRFFTLSLLLISFSSAATFAYDDVMSTRQKIKIVKKIWLTAFEPFAGRKENNSIYVANEVARMLKNADGGANRVSINVIVLPVVYDMAAEKVIMMLNTLASKGIELPDYIFSFGESGDDLHFEKTAFNLDSCPLPDNAGVVHENKIISCDLAASGIQAVLLNVDWTKGFASVEVASSMTSKKIGNYVCNNTAFLLNQSCVSREIIYGFIHVPSQRDHQTAPQVASVLQRIAF